MPTTLERHTEDGDLEDRLDELIPRPAGPFKTFAVSVMAVGVAIAVTVLTIGGYLYPRPTFGSSSGSGSHLEVDQSRDAVSATVILPNYGNRAVRITGISFDGPGAELVDVGVILEPPYDTQSQAVPVVEEQTTQVAVPLSRDGRGVAAPLPVMVPSDRTATIVVWFRPTECVDQPGPWGTVDATIDFGADAFPPFSNTISLSQDPIAFVDPDATAVNGGDVVMLRNVDGSFTEVSGPLAGACEALR